MRYHVATGDGWTELPVPMYVRDLKIEGLRGVAFDIEDENGTILSKHWLNPDENLMFEFDATFGFQAHVREGIVHVTFFGSDTKFQTVYL